MAKKTLTAIINGRGKAHKKLEAIQVVVKKARKTYGNQDEEIPSTECNTASGVQGIEYLTDSDKVAAAKAEINKIRCAAIEATKCTAGVILDREIEKLISVNPILCNLNATSGSEYI